MRKLLTIALPLLITTILALSGCRSEGKAAANLTAICSTGKIVFLSDRTGSTYQIFTMNADGSGQTQLTNTPLDHRLPKWSPDGTKIAFNWPQGKGNNIYVMNADGSNLVQLTDTSVANLYPAWSPDGSRIAFSRDVNGISQIWIMKADGTGQTQITEGPMFSREPAWSPDGTKIAFNWPQGKGNNIYVMNADGNLRWQGGGIKVSSTSLNPRPQIVIGGPGEIIVAYAFEDWKILRVQKLDSEGRTAWQENGVSITEGGFAGSDTSPDGRGGAIVAWGVGKGLFTSEKAFVQRVSADCKLLWGNAGIKLNK